MSSNFVPPSKTEVSEFSYTILLLAMIITDTSLSPCCVKGFDAIIWLQNDAETEHFIDLCLHNTNHHPNLILHRPTAGLTT